MRAALLVALLTAGASAAPVPCAGVKSFALGDSCATCGGTTIARVRRGLVHGVAVGGVFWTDALARSYTNAAGGEAEKACKDKAPWLRLPTKEDVAALAKAVNRDWSRKECEGERGFDAVMPDGRGRHFASASPVSGDARSAWGFWGTDASPESTPRGGQYGVRCVADGATALPAASTAPVDHASTAVFVEGKAEPKEFTACTTSLVNDSGVGEETAAEACKSRWSRAFYFCVYHRVNAKELPSSALAACLAAPPDATTPAPDPGKLGRWLKSCEAGNLYGCVLVGQEKTKAGDAAGARPFFEKACAGKFQPGCDALGR